MVEEEILSFENACFSPFDNRNNLILKKVLLSCPASGIAGWSGRIVVVSQR
jgi:hypothetical protein